MSEQAAQEPRAEQVAEGGKPGSGKAAKAPKAEKPAAAGKESVAQKAAIRAGDVTFHLPKTRESFSDWYDAIMDAAELLDRRYPVKGFPVFRPYGYYMQNAIMRLCEDLYERQGIHMALFPTVVPERLLKKEEEHVKGFQAECFWVEKGGLEPLEERLALRPTSETIIYSMYSKWVRSYRDLPLKMHQTCSVFRYETKNTRPLIRVREIPWNEAHTVHATEEEALQQLRDYWATCNTIFNDRLGFFGVRLQRAPWDKFAGSVFTEVLDVVMPCGRVLQTVGIHYLGQKFAEVFDISFQTKEGNFQHGYMTCCGISTRVLACALALHGDERGLVLPPLIAKVQCVVLPMGLGRKGKAEQDAAVLAKCKQIVAVLRACGMRAELDDSMDKSIGEKLYSYDVKGCPLRIELGARDLETQTCVLVARDLGKEGKRSVPLDSVLRYTEVSLNVSNRASDKDSIAAELAEAGVSGLAGSIFAQQDGEKNAVVAELDAYLARLVERSRNFHESMITTCSSLDEVVDCMKNHGGFARVPFFTTGVDGKEWDDKIRELSGGEIRGFVPSDKVPEGAVCAFTGKPAVAYAYIARSY